MKKRVTIIFISVLTAIFIAACSAGSATDQISADPWSLGLINDSMEMAAAAPMAPPAPMATPMPEMMLMEEAEYGWNDADAIHSGGDWDDSGGLRLTGGAGVTALSAPAADGFAEKIIYSVYAEIETRNFDESIAGVQTLLSRYGAFIENSSISGINYASEFYGWNDFRSAHFSLRVPKDRLDAMTESLESLGNVTHINSNATNITSQFFDTQSRLNSLNIQEERLLDMLSQAKDVPDLIAIEERLGWVRYEIESLTTTLNNWQNQVDYSTLTFNIREVEQFTERTEIHRSYWQQIGDGLMSTIRGTGRFFMNLFKWIIIAAPVLIILAVIGVAALLVVRWKLKAIEKKKAEKAKNAE